ncbi:hypothetical protein DL98DRAFT_207574 [Cadophora sp. DSE1049]|nr:hypothetical protein DL98DRAFT_207574 [Cadophora sp. DSE1049]
MDERADYHKEALQHYLSQFPNALVSEINWMADMSTWAEFDKPNGIKWTGGPNPYVARTRQVVQAPANTSSTISPSAITPAVPQLSPAIPNIGRIEASMHNPARAAPTTSTTLTTSAAPASQPAGAPPPGSIEELEQRVAETKRRAALVQELRAAEAQLEHISLQDTVGRGQTVPLTDAQRAAAGVQPHSSINIQSRGSAAPPPREPHQDVTEQITIPAPPAEKLKLNKYKLIVSRNSK